MAVPSPAANDVAHAATALVILLLVSQLPAVYQVLRKRKDIETLSPLPSLFQAGNFVAWTVYGFVKGDINIWLVNLIGTGFAIFYLTIFLIFLKGQARTRFLKFLAALVISFAGFFIPVLTVRPFNIQVDGMGDDSRQLALSIFAIAYNVLMYGAPLEAIRDAVKFKDPSRIPLLLTLAGTGSSILWGAYGLMVPNWAVFGPNVAGVVLSIIQISAVIYVHATHDKDKPRKSSGDETSPLSPRDAHYGEDLPLKRRELHDEYV